LSQSFGIGNTFCQSIVIVLAIVLTSTVNIPGILQRWQWHNGPQIGIMGSRGCTTASITSQNNNNKNFAKI